MAVLPYADVEIFNPATNAWVSVIADTQRIAVSGVGIHAARERPGVFADVGHADITLNNKAKTYNPDVDTVSTALVDVDRRIRVKYVHSVSGAGGTTQPSGSDGGTVTVGTDGSGNDIAQAQAFKISTGGRLNKITFGLGANTGSPTGTMTWEIRTDPGGTLGPNPTILATGTLTPTASATNTVTISMGPLLAANFLYWLVLHSTVKQAVSTAWNWSLATGVGDQYPSGRRAQSTAGAAWVNFPNDDLRFSITSGPFGKCLRAQHNGIANISYFFQTVTDTSVIGDVYTVTWEARAQFDSLYNSDGVQINTSAEASSQTLYNYTNKWASYTKSFTTTVNATVVEPRWYAQWNYAGTNATAIEYRNFVLTKNGGSNLYTNGDFFNGSTSPWTASNVASTAGNAALYDSPNQDAEVNLETPTAIAASSVSITGNDSTSAIGFTDLTGDNKGAAQSFQLTNSGYLDHFTFNLGANTGAPTNPMSWAIKTDNAGVPGTTIATGTLNATPSATNEVHFSGLYLKASTTYWLNLFVNHTMPGVVYWTWKYNSTSTYASGNGATFASGTWTAHSTWDFECSFYATTAFERTKLAQSFTNDVAVSFTITKVSLYLRKVGAPTGTMTLRIETSGSDGLPSGTLYNANATKTVAESTLTTSLGFIDFTFAVSWTLAAAPGTLWIVLSTDRAASDTNYVTWGTDSSSPSYLSGEMRSYISAVYVAENDDAIFKVVGTATSDTTLSVIDDYKIRFNGTIEKVAISPFVKGGDLLCTLSCADLTNRLRREMLTPTYQDNQRGDQLITTVVAPLKNSTLELTIPGVQLETGLGTFVAAFDGYTTKSSILDAIKDIALSEGPNLSFNWTDLDGTIRWVNRDYQVRAAAGRITFAGRDSTEPAGEPIKMAVERSNAPRINFVSAIAYPRQLVGGPLVLGQITSPVQIPPKQADNSPGTFQVTLNFRDATTGLPVAGKNVLQPVATTDYTVNEQADGSGVDYTNLAAFSMSVDSIGPRQMVITLRNTATGPLQVTKLQCRGDKVVVYDPLTITKTHSSVTTGAKRKQISPYAVNLPFTSDANLLNSIVSYLVNRYNVGFMEATQLDVEARVAIDTVDLLDLEIGDTCYVSDPQIGMTTPKKHFVTRISYDLSTDMGGIAAGKVSLGLMRLDDSGYWILNVSQLNVGTRLFV